VGLRLFLLGMKKIGEENPVQTSDVHDRSPGGK